MDALIIYLACGSPVGVHQILDQDAPRRSYNWAMIAASFLFWPLFGIALISNRLKNHGFADLDNSSNLIEHTRSKIENLTHLNESTISLFEFRDVYYRYTSLSLAASAKPSANANNEIFKIVGHKNPALAAKCNDRRNRQKLLYHQARSRTEFIDLIINFADASQTHAELLDLALKPIGHLNDHEALVELSVVQHQKAKTGTQSLSLPVMTLSDSALSKLQTL